MTIQPPNGSNISVGMEGAVDVIIVPYETSPMRYAVAAFMVFWLGGWLTGGTTPLRSCFPATAICLSRSG